MKARLDGEYVGKIGFFMDARCFFGTVISVLRTDGVVEGGTGVIKNYDLIIEDSDEKKSEIVS